MMPTNISTESIELNELSQRIVIDLTHTFALTHGQIAQATQISTATLRLISEGKIQKPQTKTWLRLLRFYSAYCLELRRFVAAKNTGLQYQPSTTPTTQHEVSEPMAALPYQSLILPPAYVPKKPRALKKADRKMYFLGKNFPEVYFTQREMECLQYLLEGKTLPMTAKILNLSVRTIEFYVNNMKIKVGVRTKIELLQKVAISELKSQLPLTSMASERKED